MWFRLHEVRRYELSPEVVGLKSVVSVSVCVRVLFGVCVCERVLRLWTLECLLWSLKMMWVVVVELSGATTSYFFRCR